MTNGGSTGCGTGPAGGGQFGSAAAAAARQAERCPVPALLARVAPGRPGGRLRLDGLAVQSAAGRIGAGGSKAMPNSRSARRTSATLSYW